MAGSCGALGWMNGLPRKNARPVPNEHERDPDRDVVDARQAAQPGVQRAEHDADEPRDEHAEPRASRCRYETP